MMNKIKWFFMSRYKKLLYNIKQAEENKQLITLPNGVKLDFRENKVPVCMLTKTEKRIKTIIADYALPDYISCKESPEIIEKHVKKELVNKLALGLVEHAEIKAMRNFYEFNTLYRARVDILV